MASRSVLPAVTLRSTEIMASEAQCPTTQASLLSPVLPHASPPFLASPSAAAQKLTDPIAGRSSCDGPTVSIDVSRFRAMFKQQGDDPALFGLCDIRARVALARVLDGQVQGGGATLVHQPRISTVRNEGRDRVGTAAPDGSVQRCDAALVHDVGTCTCLDEVSDYLALSASALVARSRTPVRGVVQRFGTPSIASTDICASRYKRIGEFGLMRGGSNMQCCVTRIHVVMNFNEEVRVGVMAARSDTE